MTTRASGSGRKTVLITGCAGCEAFDIANITSLKDAVLVELDMKWPKNITPRVSCFHSRAPYKLCLFRLASLCDCTSSRGFGRSNVPRSSGDGDVRIGRDQN